MQIYEKYTLGSVSSSEFFKVHEYNSGFFEIKSILGELEFHRHVKHTYLHKS